MWKRQNVLITAKTYPEYSKKYTETVCTAGILKESRKLIRLYPIPYRYLEGNEQFSKYQWINVEIRKSRSDDRPESYNIREGTIISGPIIDAQGDGWEERGKWMLSPNNLYESVEALLQARKKEDISLGIIKPKEIFDFKVVKKSEADIKEANQKKNVIMSQLGMLVEKKELDLLPVKFTLHFLCEDHQCKGHKLGILDWEIGQLYRRIKDDQNWKKKIRYKVMDEICGESRETYLILGNMALHRHIFCILGFFWPPKQRQRKLF